MNMTNIQMPTYGPHLEYLSSLGGTRRLQINFETKLLNEVDEGNGTCIQYSNPWEFVHSMTRTHENCKKCINPFCTIKIEKSEKYHS
jgi:hypothetical protein